MKKITTYLLSTSLILFLSACGSTFEASQDAEAVTSSSGFDQGFTQESSIVLTDLQRLMFNRIRGFDFNLRNFGSADQVRVLSKITLGCDSIKEFSTDVSFNQLFSGQKITVGIDAEFLIRVQCVASNCEDAVVYISEPQGFTELPVAMRAYAPVDNTMVYSNYPHKDYVSFISGGVYNERNSCVPIEETPSGKDQVIDIFKDRIGEAVTDKIKDFFSNL